MRTFFLALALAASGAVAAPATSPGGTPIVHIENFAFAPNTVTIRAGGSVRFVNADQDAHTVTAKSGDFDSGGLDGGQTWTHRFTKAGTYIYFCQLHPYMRGTVVVREAEGGGT